MMASWSAESAPLWLCEAMGRPPQPWRVLSVHTHACNLENGDGAIAALVSPRHGNGPFHVVAPAAIFATLTRGEPVYLGAGLIRLSSGILDARSAECWSPRLPHAASTPLDSYLLHYLTLVLHEKLASALIPHPQQKMTILQGRVSEGLAALQRGWQTDDLSQVANGARQLAGLGPGLTPAGDDLLVGWLAGIFFLGEGCGLGPKVKRVAGAVVDVATSQTTRLSAAWLHFAGNGELAEPWHQLANGLNRGDTIATEQVVDRILGTGATSGHDAMIGFRSAMQLFATVR
jgi:hypothetical protein